MKSFFAAVSFLTILRIPANWCGDERALARSLTWFPVVGLLVGILMAILDQLLCWLFPGLQVPSALLVIAMIAVSGGLHLDGLADSADAFMSSRPREQMLEIMKDSRCGPMGVLTISALLLLKFSALSSLEGDWRTPTIVLMPLAGRTALVLKTVGLNYVRESGLVSLFQKESHYGQGVASALLLGVSAFFLLGAAGIWVVIACLFVTWLFALYCRAKLGGLTGDTLGATCEIVELVPVLTVLVCLQQGLLV
jgi:adenosylcobinamide-GDP ribazoletransferase